LVGIGGSPLLQQGAPTDSNQSGFGSIHSSYFQPSLRDSNLKRQVLTQILP